jgi:hypothetical protein
MIPVIHYSNAEYALVSPCGDKDEESIVTSDMAEVTCLDCVEAMTVPEPTEDKPKKRRKKSDN